MDEKLVVPKQQ